MTKRLCVLGIVLCLGFVGSAGSQGQGDPRAADKAAIQNATKAFVKAFEKGDAKAVAAHWTTEGEYIDDDGTILRGRANIEKSYTEFFKKHANLKAEVESESIRFISRDSAIEEGHFKVRTGKKEEQTQSRYSVLHVREGDKWLMAVVREWPSQGISLRDLDWLVGTWSAKRNGVEVISTYEWDKNKVYLNGRFTIKEKDGSTSGTKRIAKDPSTGFLRSWTFENDGEFGEATWSRDGTKWIVEASGVLTDGSTMTATNILVRIDDDNFTWQTLNRVLNDTELPDVAPIKVTRVKASK